MSKFLDENGLLYVWGKIKASFGPKDEVAANTAARHSHANKAVLDGVSAAKVTAWDGKLDKSGGTMTGTLTLSGAPTADLHAATKKYVDDSMAAAGNGDMLKSVYDTDGDGVVDRAAAADRVAKKFILQNNAGQQMAEFDGSADRTVQLTPGQVGAEPAFTKNNAFNKNFGSAAGTVCQGNDGRLSNARRASNISMSLSGTTLTINYS